MKKRFNIADLAICAVIAAVIAAVILVIGIRPGSDTADTKTVIVEVKQKNEAFCSIPKEGDIISDAATKEEIGVLVSAKKVPATIELTSAEEAKFVKSQIPGYYDLYLTIKLNSAADYAKIGKSLYIQGRSYACSGYVTDVLESEGTVQ